MAKIKTVGIALSHRKTAVDVWKKTKRVLERRKIKTIVTSELDLEKLKQNKSFLKSDIIIVFGGDGSFLKVCQAVLDLTPVFLVGCGERNVLQTINAQYAPEQLEEILSGKFRVEKRNRLKTNLKNASLALNEVLITAKTPATILHYELALSGKKEWHDYSDGVIIATTTGSNAYFLSAGGPKLEQNAPIIGIASLNSLEGNKKMVCQSFHRIQIQKISSTKEVIAIIDGQAQVPLSGELQIQDAEKPLSMGFPLLPEKPHPVNTKNWTPGMRFTFRVLTEHGASTPSQLAVETGLSAKSIHRALESLIAGKKIERRPFSGDRRQDLYHIV